MGEKRPQRRANRLPSFDYTSPNYYFITFCVENGDCLLWREPLETWNHRLSPYGLLVERTILSIDGILNVRLQHYTVMPNHIHMIVQLAEQGEAGMANLSNIVRYVKSTVTKSIGRSIWQKSYYDHVIRDEKDYFRIWEYIENNPAKWKEDRYYRP